MASYSSNLVHNVMYFELASCRTSYGLIIPNFQLNYPFANTETILELFKSCTHNNNPKYHDFRTPRRRRPLQ